MKKNPSYPIGRRMLSFVMVLLMAFPWVSTPAMAASEWSNGLEIKISWTDINGNTVESEAASLISWAQGDVFWLTLSSDILQNSLTLKINNPNYPGYSYTPNNGDSLGIVTGADNLEGNPVLINVNNESGTPVTDPSTAIRLYISAAPKPPAEADIRVIFQGTDGTSLRGDGSFHAVEGQENRITPEQTSFENGYTLTAETPEFVISFDGNGLPSTDTVTFLYNPPAPPKEADIRVIYQGTDGASLRGDGSFHAVEGQENRITPEQTAFENGYTLTAETPEFVISFDGNGVPSTDTVTFLYNPPATPPTEEPTPKPPAEKEIDVYYIGTDGADLGIIKYLVKGGQNNPVVAPPTIDKDGAVYTLSGPGEQNVTLDENGEPNPPAVTFNYDPPVTPPPTEQPIPAEIEIDVHYIGTDEADLGSYKFIAVEAQENRIEAPTIPEGHAGYTLTGDSVQYVTVNSNGEANPSSVIFRYTPNLIPVTIEYLKDGQYLGDGSQSIPAGSQNMPVNADPNMTPAGYQLEGASFVNVSVDTQGVATPSKVTFNFVKIPAQSVQVPIEYTKQGVVFKTDARTIAIPGNGTVDANPDPVPDGYRLEGASSVNVTVDTLGKATPEKVIFNYVPIPVATIRIEYLKEGQPLGDGSQNIPAGSINVPVNADPNMTPAGYQLEGAASVNVTVDDQGKATPEKVTFNFVKIPAQSVQVPIEYIKEGVVFKTDFKPISIPGNGTVDANPNPVPAGYQLEGASSVNVSVDVSGVATPSKVTFNYVPIPAVKKTITVYYRNESNGDIATAQQKVLGVGTHQISPDPVDLQANYRIKGDIVKIVTVNQDGTSNADSVTFVYEYVPPVVETPIPVGSVIDRWGVINKNNVNFRTSPAKANNNGIKQLSKNAYVWMYESQYNDASEVWTRANVDGQDGYIMTEFINMMTQAESDAYQATLQNPMPTRSPAPTNTNTPTPTPTPTPVPSQYTGYALTKQQVALRVEVSNSDQSILTTLPKNTLVNVKNQVYQGSTPWSLVETLDGNIGNVPDNSLRRINQEEAKYYIDQYNAAHPTASPTPTPSPVPVQQHSYAATLGDNVPMRGAADPNSMLVNMLAKNTVVYVSGQEYLNGTAWHIVQYKGQWGYIRADQLRWLSKQETEAYLKSLNTPTPTPANTLPPLDQNSASSYGYVTSDKVNFRSTPGGTVTGTLNKYAFALVLGSTQSGGKTWYKVNQAGKEGYISGDFFHVLSLAELEDFLQSPEYSQGTSGNTGVNNNNNNNGGNSGEPPTSPEDLNVGTWTNPNTGLNATYEPFDPYATPEPLPTPTPSPTPEPLATFVPLPTEPPVETQSDSSSFIWMGLGITLLGGVGGLYAYALHKSSQRKAAVRAAQRRAAMQQNLQSGARPYARTTNAPKFSHTTGTQARPGTPPAGAQRPQTPGSTSPNSQHPAVTRPPAQPGAAPTAFPGQQPSAFTRSTTGTQPGTQTPASVRSEAQGMSATPDGQTGATQHDSALNNTTRQPRTVRYTGNSPADQSTPTDTNENL